MKKICFVTTVPLTMRVFILGLAEYIHANTDWEISMICSPEDGFEKEIPEYIHFFPVTMKRGISIGGLTAIIKMIKIFRQEKYDLVQYSTPNAAFYASVASWLTKTPIRLYCQWGMIFTSFKGIKRRIFKIIERIECALSTEIEPDSKANLKFAHQEKIYPMNKGKVIWNGSASGVNLKKFDVSKKEAYRKVIRHQLHINESKFTYIFVGRITRDKGINELLSVFKGLTKEKDVHLILVGPSEQDPSVDNELYQWAVNSEDVSIVGYTNDVEKYLSAADCYVLPSYHEGFGMSIIEAEAMGVPVIVTRIPGPVDAVVENETGIIVEKKNLKQLRRAMRYFADNTDIAKVYGEKGRLYVEQNFNQEVLHRYILDDRIQLLEGRN